MWSISRKCDIFVLIACLWPVDDIYQRFVMEPICQTQSVVEPRFSVRQNDFSREMDGFRRDSLLMISATFLVSTRTTAWKLQHRSFDNFMRRFSDRDYNHGQKSWDTFAYLGHFPIHTGPTPPLTSQTMLDACIQNFFWVSTLCRLGGGRTARKFRKRRTVSWGNRKVTEKFECCITNPRTIVALLISSEGTRVKFRHPIQH